MLRGDRGMVTVEAAIATGSLVAVLALVLAAMAAMLLQVRCVDAAAEAARLGSRGDVDGARRAAARLLPADASITVEVRDGDVVVGVDAVPLGSALRVIRVGARAVASREPDAIASGEPGADTDAPATAPSGGVQGGAGGPGGGPP